MSKKDTRKAREYAVYGKTVDKVSEIVIEIGPGPSDISFKNEMSDVYSEVWYERTKKPKVLSRIPQDQSNSTFNENDALRRNFDVLCAVDTNTRLIRGKSVSVVGALIADPVLVPGPSGFVTCWPYEVAFLLEHVEVKGKPENFGWVSAHSMFRRLGRIHSDQRIGMIVDSNLGSLAAYNDRSEPVFAGEYLPKNIQLIYATADAGKEQMVNQFLSYADSTAAKFLDALKNGSAPPNEMLSNGKWCEGTRLLLDRQLIHCETIK